MEGLGRVGKGVAVIGSRAHWIDMFWPYFGCPEGLHEPGSSNMSRRNSNGSKQGRFPIANPGKNGTIRLTILVLNGIKLFGT